MLVSIFALAACGTATDTAADSGAHDTADTATDTADTDTGDTDVDPGGLFFHATGTVDGAARTWSCDETSPGYAFYSTVRSGDGLYALGGTCADSSGYYAEVAATTGEPASAGCVPAQWGVAVLNLANSQSWNCALDGATTLEVVVDELTPEGDGSVTWGGSFHATSDGTSTYFEADLSGSFRFKGVPG